jgi:protoporphyrinogen oxidase
MIRDKKKIVIIGAGPCGLGAAWRLNELGMTNYEVFEKNAYAGGLSSSFVDEKGFTWDIGGHVLFSHYDYFDLVMETAIPAEGWVPHERESWIWIKNRFIPYPLQYNIGRLPEKDMIECLVGLIHCSTDNENNEQHVNFLEWIHHTFGEGLAKHFFIPYNKKVWAYPLEELTAQWTGERVAVPDVKRVIDIIMQGKDDCSWGPNNTFTFPLYGGTGAIWRALAEKLPPEKIYFNSELVALDCEKKILKFKDGKDEHYDYLITTIPIDQLIPITASISSNKEDKFVYSSSNIIGIGLEGEPPEQLRTKCWMYFPEDDNPFYRVTVFSNYSRNNVPRGGYWSLMGEIAESTKKSVIQDHLIDEALQGFYHTKLIEKNANIISTWSYRAEYAYPTPFLGRDEMLNRYLVDLQKKGIYSRGRFGAWKYECGNQDHALMQGVEAVENILFGTPELTLNHPSFVNTHRLR